MSMVSGTEEPAAPGEVVTSEVAKNTQEDTPPRQLAMTDDEEDVYEDASDVGGGLHKLGCSTTTKGKYACSSTTGATNGEYFSTTN